MYTSHKTQNQLRNLIRQELSDIGICNSIKKSYPEKWDDFMYLFKRHSHYPDKFIGLVDIQIRYNKFNYLETSIIKNNGEIEAISLLHNCVTGKSKDRLAQAMRTSILPQIFEFKNANILECQICGDDENIHIDHHYPQFIELKTIFIKKYDGVVPEEFDWNDSMPEFKKDEDFNNKWFQYHKANANLRVLCKGCNLSRNRKNSKRCISQDLNIK
tara:strand:+ start:52 stop:696 length:645 start_codon:yes stop_codon:yes gene_type:complete